MLRSKNGFMSFFICGELIIGKTLFPHPVHHFLSTADVKTNELFIWLSVQLGTFGDNIFFIGLKGVFGEAIQFLNDGFST